MNLRARYRPPRIKVVFVLESPPISGNYFYNPTGRVTKRGKGGVPKRLRINVPGSPIKGISQEKKHLSQRKKCLFFE